MNNQSPEDLMHVGHHFRDIPRANRRQNLIGDGQLPRTVIHDLLLVGIGNSQCLIIGII